MRKGWSLRLPIWEARKDYSAIEALRRLFREAQRDDSLIYGDLVAETAILGGSEVLFSDRNAETAISGGSAGDSLICGYLVAETAIWGGSALDEGTPGNGVPIK